MGDILPFRSTEIQTQDATTAQLPLVVQDALTCPSCEGQVFIVQASGAITCRDCFTVSNNFNNSGTEGNPFFFDLSLASELNTPIIVKNGFPTGGIVGPLTARTFGAYYGPLDRDDPYTIKWNFNVQYNVFDQDRAAFVFGYRMNRNWRVESGFMEHVVFKSNGIDVEHNHTMTFGLSYSRSAPQPAPAGGAHHSP